MGFYRDSYEGYGRSAGGFSFPRVSSAVKMLIIINAAVFLAQVAFSVAGINLSEMFGVRATATIDRLHVWQIFTYMFLHSPRHLLHIFMNMLFLYWFGTEVERLLGRRRFLFLYLGSGVAGGLSYAMTQYLFGIRIPAIGASAAVMGVLVVYAFHYPSRIILLFFVIPMTIKWFVLMIVGVDLVYSITTYADGVAHTAHLGGALFGFLYHRLAPRFAWFFDRLEDRHREREAKRRSENEQRMDEILAKIGREGFDSLTRAERDFLRKQSEERRDRGYHG